MVVTVVPLVLLILGALIYALAANVKASEMGRIMFFCGLLVLTFALAREVLRIG